MSLRPRDLFAETFRMARTALFANRLRSLLALLGIVIGVVYTLKTTAKVFFPDRAAAADAHHDDHELEPISVPERLGAALLIFCTVLIGLHPRLLLDVIVPSFSSPLFDGLRKAVAQ